MCAQEWESAINRIPVDENVMPCSCVIPPIVLLPGHIKYTRFISHTATSSYQHLNGQQLKEPEMQYFLFL